MAGARAGRSAGGSGEADGMARRRGRPFTGALCACGLQAVWGVQCLCLCPCLCLCLCPFSNPPPPSANGLFNSLGVASLVCGLLTAGEVRPLSPR